MWAQDRAVDKRGREVGIDLFQLVVDTPISVVIHGESVNELTVWEHELGRALKEIESE